MCNVNRENSHTAFFRNQNKGGAHDAYNLQDAFQTGGGGFNNDFDNSLHHKSRVDFGTYEGCGAINDSNLGASALPVPMDGGGYSYNNSITGVGGRPYHTYQGGDNLGDFKGSYAPLSVQERTQCGGTRKKNRKTSGFCRKISKIKKHSQVHFFWSFMCKDINKLYAKKIRSKEKSHPKQVTQFIRRLTSALCCAVTAKKTTKAKTRNSKIKQMKKALYMCKCILRKIGVKRHNLKTIENCLMKTIRKGGTRRKRRKATRRRHRRGRRRTRRQRGGYAQFGSNVPNTPSYSTPNGGSSALAQPVTFKRTDNCVDNYNHYA
jgi:hypothetical protein